jgi:hypothetical protein
VRELIADAFRAAELAAVDEPLTSDMYAYGARELRRALGAMQNVPFSLFVKATQTLTLTTAVSYTLATRAVRVLNVNIVVDDIETPISVMTRDEYDRMPVKTSTGRPCSCYIDHQQASTILYVWPKLSTANGETLKITYERQITDPSSPGAQIDIPREWESAVMYDLATRVCLPYGGDPSSVAALASRDLAGVLESDREGSVYFAGPYAE